MTALAGAALSQAPRGNPFPLRSEFLVPPAPQYCLAGSGVTPTLPLMSCGICLGDSLPMALCVDESKFPCQKEMGHMGLGPTTTATLSLMGLR